ncbi:hypothetical protein DFQ01_12181 [Paenibacillus cellulosilyticus]|uniref:Uncharacterized protein n=1 Tax=Paenibacillus cellulosilyticus TaxID=375489 RepID=A0A2V2YNY3_9BACL|nr:hypothetical protein [Paenibacillus cellulosilyticus]PWV97437.1 hypothetical protein DFQ01_12181 [Paenibacillus cellulosilyticus]QKS48524.1 hypothetical protein HUB94_30280 [Paenibacillus cellulosilyticus]
MTLINITDKLSTARPQIQIGDKHYDVNDSLESVFKFEELAAEGSTKKVLESITAALGEEAIEEIGVKKMSVANLKVLTTAVMAAMQGLTYEEADARFQRAGQ